MVQTSARSEAKRAEILRRAAGLFRERGFHGAGMRDIARSLGMAPGALYYYFESKEDLLYACQRIALRGLLKSARAIASADDAPETKVRRIVHTHLEHVLGELGGSLAHMEFHALPAELRAKVVRQRDRYERLLRRLLREGVRKGAFRELDPRLTALSLLGALNWTVVWWRPEGRHSIGSVARNVADTFLGGIVR